MSSIRSDRPDDRERLYTAEQQQQGLTNAQQIQEVKDEVEMAALAVFLQSTNQTPSSGTDSKKGKLQDIEKELQDGVITPQEAISFLASIAQEAPQISDLKLPPIDAAKIDEGKTSLLVHTEVFALFVNEHVKAKHLPPQLLNQTVQLANLIHNDSLPVRQGAESLTALVGQANQLLPLSQRYPEYRSDLFT